VSGPTGRAAVPLGTLSTTSNPNWRDGIDLEDDKADSSSFYRPRFIGIPTAMPRVSTPLANRNIARAWDSSGMRQEPQKVPNNPTKPDLIYPADRNGAASELAHLSRLNTKGSDVVDR